MTRYQIAAVLIVTVLVLLRLSCRGPREPRPRDTDLLEQHRCRPPQSHEHTPGEWITRRALGDEWRCRCGRGWRVGSGRLWLAWYRADDLDLDGVDS